MRSIVYGSSFLHTDVTLPPFSETQQRSRLVQGTQGRLRNVRSRTDGRCDRTARRGLSRLCPRARRLAAEIALPDLSRYSLQRQQGPAEDARRRRLSVAWTAEA